MDYSSTPIQSIPPSSISQSSAIQTHTSAPPRLTYSPPKPEFPSKTPSQKMNLPSRQSSYRRIKRDVRSPSSSENYIRTINIPNGLKPFKLGLTQINDMFYIGSIEDFKTTEILSKYKINCVLNLSQNDILTSQSMVPIQCYNCPLSLKSFCCMMQSLPKCLNIIETAIDNNQRIAILCRDGFTKALNLIIAFYLLKYSAKYEEVRDQLIDLIPEVIPHMNAEYEQHLQKMAAMIHIRSSNEPTQRISRPQSYSH